MKEEYRMEQHYAVSISGLLVHIAEAHLSNEDFYCPHCKCRMLKNVELLEVGISHMTIDIRMRMFVTVLMNLISMPMLN